MFTPELAALDFQECRDLPPGTLVGPFSVVREIRCVLGKTHLNLLVGDQEAVQVSPDLFAAFQAWEQSLETTDEDDDAASDDYSSLN